MPTTNYSLHLKTDLNPYDVLETLFSTDSIEPIAGAGYCTHAAVSFWHTGASVNKNCGERFKQAFGVRPSVSVAFFPDGVSSFNTALTKLIEAVVHWLNQTEDDLLLVSNSDMLVLKRENNLLTLNRSHSFWTPPRLTLIEQPYKTA